MPRKKATTRQRVPRTRAGGTLTESQYWGFIRSGLRAKWTRWPPRFHVLNAASRPYTGPDKRRKKEYQCAICTKWHPQKQVEVDHIVPCGSLKSYEDLPGFVERLLCEEDHLRVVCKPCHKKITRGERDE